MKITKSSGKKAGGAAFGGTKNGSAGSRGTKMSGINRFRVQEVTPPVSRTAARFRIVLVEPGYELNVGSTARAMKNFGFSELYVVNPKCSITGFDAIKYSKHAREILHSAKIVRTLAAATKGCKFSVATTGILYRHFHTTMRTPISLRSLKAALGREKQGRVALVFGNEGVGLSEKHISECDIVITIPTNKLYSVLNLSHAVAIVLYELSSLPVLGFTPASEAEKTQLAKSFSLLVNHFSKDLRNPKKVKISFRRMVGKALLTDKECVSILGVLRRTAKELEKKKKR